MNATNTLSTATPVQTTERMHVLDILRGFALFGILMMNIEYFQRPMQAIMMGLDQSQTGIDYVVGLFVYVFIQGKFYTLFSLLFGIGFVIFLDRAKAKVDKPRWLFFRRLAILAVIGAVHAFLIWAGDILLSYAFVGLFLMLLFHNTSVSRLWKWGLALIIFPLVLFALGALGISMAMQYDPEGTAIAFDEQHAALLNDIMRGDFIYAQGSYWEVVQWRIYEMGQLYLGAGFVFFIPSILALFLFGAACARAGLFQDIAGNIRYFKRFAVWGYGLGIPAALAFAYLSVDMDITVPTYQGALGLALQTLANIALCFAYLSTFVLLMHYGKRWVQIFAPAGRMALTNYLLHSIVFTLIFYGYGLGLYGEIGRAAATGMAILLYVGQLFASQWWLQRYQYGPMEWVWRSLTYGRRQPFKI
ncbi:DUF418 domain-containing protein [Aliidiomarina indica]|uniref:DUF418 domain-containing protein n=1 Tax=Aliidiomarina indica TaxID=2749147 RepID=UPI00188DE062|nr:DUF418 domain-containing protein [Aliidiomarina indica]